MKGAHKYIRKEMIQCPRCGRTLVSVYGVIPRHKDLDKWEWCK